MGSVDYLLQVGVGNSTVYKRTNTGSIARDFFWPGIQFRARGERTGKESRLGVGFPLH